MTNETVFKKQTFGNFEAVGFVTGLTEDSFQKNLVGKNNPSWIYSRMNLRLGDEAGKNFYLNVQDGYSNVKGKDIYVQDSERNQLIIKFDQRTNAALLAAVDKNSFINVGIKREMQKDENGKEFMGWTYEKFLTQYDLITYLAGRLAEGQKVKVTGSVKYSEYNGNVNREYTIKRVLFLDAADTQPTGFKFTQNILLDSDSVDMSKFDELLVAEISAKAYQKKRKNEYVVYPLQFVVRATEANKDKIKRMIDKYFVVNDNSVVRRINVEGLYNTGYISSSITEADLSPEALELIEDGIYTKEEIMSKFTNREKVDEMQITKPCILRDQAKIDFADNEYTKEDLENLEVAIQEETIVEAAASDDDLSFLDELDV